jgi:hypothetical protein
MQTIIPLARTMQLPLNLAGGLRSIFAEVASSPLPERLAALARRLDAHCVESSGEGRDEGKQQKGRAVLNRRGTTPQPDGSAVRRRTA